MWALLRSKLGRARPLAAAADATEIWAPPLTRVEPPIIQLPDELDRIVAFNKTVTREEFVKRTVVREHVHPATRAFLLRDAIIADGAVYANRRVERIFQPRRRLAWAGQPEPLEDRLLATGWTTEQYFGHWLLDGLSMELLAEQTGHKALGLARTPWLQEPEYRALVGMRFERTRLARVRNLWMADDRPMNQSRIDRMAELRRRIRGAAPVQSSGAPVFLRRIAGVKRLLLNQDALADALARRGFTILTPEAEPIERLRSALRDARLVVSVEGSALCHAVACMADGGTMLAIQPPRRVDWIQKVWTDCAGLRLAQTVADDRGDGFEMDEGRLMRLCDLIARENSVSA